MSLPGTAAIPAVHSDRIVAAELSGTAAVALIHNPISWPPSRSGGTANGTGMVDCGVGIEVGLFLVPRARQLV